MKGYLSVSGGIIHLLIELTLHTAPSKSLETNFYSPDLSPPHLLLLLTHLPLTHLPLCASLRVNILFSPSLFHTLLFTYSSIVGFYIHEGPIYSEELPRFSGIWTVPPRTDLSRFPRSVLPILKNRRTLEMKRGINNCYSSAAPCGGAPPVGCPLPADGLCAFVAPSDWVAFVLGSSNLSITILHSWRFSDFKAAGTLKTHPRRHGCTTSSQI